MILRIFYSLCKYILYIRLHRIVSRPVVRFFLFHFFSLPCVGCKRTISPGRNVLSSFAPRSWYFFCVSCRFLMRLSTFLFILGWSNFSDTGRVDFVRWLRSRWAGLVSWIVCGVFRTARRARYTSSPEALHVRSIHLACLTADSALPFDWW